MNIYSFTGRCANSIQDTTTGKSLFIDILPFDKTDLKQVLKKNRWKFNWRDEFKNKNHCIYKLVIRNGTVIQGLISIEKMPNFIEMHLIETAPHNYGRNKKYTRVPGNLVAYICKMSFDSGFEGVVSFMPKTGLIQHYINTLGAELIYKNKMAINTSNAKKLLYLYYKNYTHVR